MLVVGAGIAGLMAATDLRQAGCSVRVVDKGRGVGGRLATRRLGEATFDHGAQCLDLEGSPASEARWLEWLERLGPTRVPWWPSGAAAAGGTEACRWRGAPSMSAVAKHLARDLEVHRETLIDALRTDDSGWIASVGGVDSFAADAVVLTPPVPQALAVLEAGRVPLPTRLRERLTSIDYDRCLTVMAVLEHPSRVPPPGSLAPASGPLAWISDNLAKGISAVPSVTLQATARFSLDHWDEDRSEVGRQLIEAASDWIGHDIREFQVHGWRYSRPRTPDPEPCLPLDTPFPLVLAGDAFGAGGLGGAAWSGCSAARGVLDRLANRRPDPGSGPKVQP